MDLLCFKLLIVRGLIPYLLSLIHIYLGKYSSNLFTLNMFYSANKRMLAGKQITKEIENFVYSYWKNVSENMIQWNELRNKEISKVDLRENYIVTQGVVILSLIHIFYISGIMSNMSIGTEMSC